MGRVWSTQIDIHFVFAGIESFWSNNLRCILCSWYDTGLVNTFLVIFRIFAGIQHMLRCIMCSLFWEGFGLDTISIEAGKRCVWSTQVQIHIVSPLAWVWSKLFEMNIVYSLACDGFVQHNWHTFFVFPWMGGVCSTFVKVHFGSSLAWEGFG